MADSSQNIRVAIRMRPLNSREVQDGSTVCCELFPEQATVQISDPEMAADPKAKSAAAKTFSYDYIYDSSKEAHQAGYANQEMVFRDLGQPLIDGAVFQGFNGCLFAYGLTGTGKTYSMMGYGDVSQRGIVPRCLDRVFGDIEGASSEKLLNPKIKCQVSYMEFYNDKLRDLLDASKDSKELSVHSHPEHGVYITNLKEVVTTERSLAEELLQFGNKMKSVASTNMNAVSSRSHTIFILKFEIDEKITKVNMVDLAGRENEKNTAAKGDRFKELTFINKSLFELASCIHALASGAKNIPFRNNKLTLALSDSLSGQSKTSMLAAVTPAASSYVETLATLRFASATKTIKTKKVVSAGAPKSEIIAALKKEIEDLKAELEAYKAGKAEADNGQGLPATKSFKKAPILSEEEQQNQEVVKIELEEKLAAADAVVNDLSKDWNEEVKESHSIFRQQSALLQSLGLLTDKQEAALIEKDTPFFMNLSDDAFLSGRLLFFLNEQQPSLIGNEHGIDNIFVTGVGVFPSMAQVAYRGSSKGVWMKFNTPQELVTDNVSDNESSENLELKQNLLDFEANAKLYVNGKRMKVGDEIRLNHNDRIVIGHAMALRILIPTEAQVQDVVKSQHLSIGDFKVAMSKKFRAASMKFSTKMTSLSPKAIKPPVNALTSVEEALEELEDPIMTMSNQPAVEAYFKSIGKPNEVSQFMKKLQSYYFYVDEANQLTLQLRAADHLVFRIALMMPLAGNTDSSKDSAPSVCVRLIQLPANSVSQASKPSPKQMQRRKKNKKSQEKSFESIEAAKKLFGVSEDVLNWMALTGEGRVQTEESEIFVWTMEKFMDRLRQMRDLFDRFNYGHKEHVTLMTMRSKRSAKGASASDNIMELPIKVNNYLAENPFEDPWREFGPQNVEMLAKARFELLRKSELLEKKVKELQKKGKINKPNALLKTLNSDSKSLEDLEMDLNNLQLMAESMIVELAPNNLKGAGKRTRPLLQLLRREVRFLKLNFAASQLSDLSGQLDSLEEHLITLSKDLTQVNAKILKKQIQLIIKRSREIAKIPEESEFSSAVFLDKQASKVRPTTAAS